MTYFQRAANNFIKKATVTKMFESNWEGINRFVIKNIVALKYCQSSREKQLLPGRTSSTRAANDLELKPLAADQDKAD